MANGRLARILTIMLGLAMIGLFTITAMAADAPRMTKEELKAQIDSSDVFIVDVRIGKDWKASEFKIKGAVKENPKDFDSWANKYPQNKILVLYCA